MFDGDYQAVVAKVTLAVLEAGMKKSLVDSLSVEEWRVDNVKCSPGSIITGLFNCLYGKKSCVTYIRIRIMMSVDSPSKFSDLFDFPDVFTYT